MPEAKSISKLWNEKMPSIRVMRGVKDHLETILPRLTMSERLEVLLSLFESVTPEAQGLAVKRVLDKKQTA
jgi:hypothetical protein